ncbi:CBS domain-containing protein [Vibrio hippocampi]|uniref:Inosine-5'-monophosphate dehydrogenase n=1 Tax=Vibrio hippocampi TaxID=654686 RepID=A0ABM8ZGS9_9VIBR|nr:CBS domain-containing protein [Vibrio hippocampi]CAH0524855.1 Inosine-5'-monophosphate dehydrogenase [Vibrio hippocampi]
MIKVEDIMTRNPHTLLCSHTLSDAKDMMQALDIRHIPIVDVNKALLGIVSQRDVLAAQESSLHKVPNNQSYTLSTPLHEVMRSDIVTVDPKGSLRASALYMQKHKVGCLPVVHKRQLVGIITNSDFVAIAINLLEIEEDIEPEEID